MQPFERLGQSKQVIALLLALFMLFGHMTLAGATVIDPNAGETVIETPVESTQQPDTTLPGGSAEATPPPELPAEPSPLPNTSLPEAAPLPTMEAPANLLAPMAASGSSIHITAEITSTTVTNNQTTTLKVMMTDEATNDGDDFFNGRTVSISLPSFLVPQNLQGVVNDNPYLTGYTYQNGVITFTIGGIPADEALLSLGFDITLTVKTTGSETGNEGTIIIDGKSLTIRLNDTSEPTPGSSLSKGLFSNFKPSTTGGGGYVVENTALPIVYSLNVNIDPYANSATIVDTLNSHLKLTNKDGVALGTSGVTLQDCIMFTGGISKPYGAAFPQGIAAEQSGNGFQLTFTDYGTKSETTGKYPGVESLTIRYFAKLDNPAYNGTISNVATLTVDDRKSGEDEIEMLTYNTYALSIKKFIMDGSPKSSIVIDENDAELAFRLSLQQFGNDITPYNDGYVFATDQLASAFTLQSDVSSVVNGPFALKGTSGGSKVEVVKTGGSTTKLQNGTYTLDFTVKVDMDKVVPGKRMENRLSEDTVVYIYPEAKLIIEKIWNGTGTKEAVTFELRRGNDLVASTTLPESATSATMRFSHLTPGLLDGTHEYLLKEVVSEGSSFGSALSIPITITKTATEITFSSGDNRLEIGTGASGTATFTNDLDDGKGSITFNKTASDKAKLTGGVFSLYTSAGAAVSLTGSNGTYAYAAPGTAGSVTFFSVKDGKAFIDGLPYGTYYIKEDQAPAGYVRVSEKTADVTLKKSNKHADLTLNNTLYQAGKISITKKDQNAAFVSGVSFTLSKLQGGTYQVVTTKATNSSGYVEFTGLPSGSYQIKETVPQGYTGYTSPINVTIDENGTAVTQTVNENGPVSGGSTIGSSVGFDWKNTKLYGSIRIIKSDSSNSATLLPGAKFTLTGNGVGPITVETNAQGEAKFENLPYGTYSIKEITAPAGYVISSPDTKSIVLDTLNKDVDWANAKQKGSISIYKKDAEQYNGTEIPLGNVLFELLNAANEKVKEGYTNASGRLTFSDIPEGAYTLREVSAPTGYVLDPQAKAIVIGKQSDNSYIWSKSAEFTNARVKQSLKVTKLDETGTALPGAKFQLTGTDLAGKTYTSAIVTTDASGIATFENVPYGTYTLKETEAPQGYALAADKTIVFNQKYENNVYTVTLTNAPYRLTVYKIGADSSVKLSGAQFRIKSGSQFVKATDLGDGSYRFTQYVSSADAATDFVTAGANGSFTVTHLPKGDYQINETKAPAGYVLTTQVHTVSVTGSTTGYDRTFANSDIKGSLQLLKTDHNDRRLAGIRFTVTGPSGTFTETTNADGYVTFTNLLYGEYTITEDPATTPEGFAAASPFTLKVEQNGVTVSYTVKNLPVVGTVSIAKRGMDGKALPNAVFEMRPVDANGSIITNGAVHHTISDASGVAAFTNIPYGVYAIREQVAPIGYIKDTAVRYVRIGNAPIPEGITVESDNAAVVWDNIPLSGKLALHKTDGTNSLSGASFALYRATENGTEPVALTLYQATTLGVYAYNGLASSPTSLMMDSAGYAEVSGLPYGAYVLREIAAPAGYVKDQEDRTFFISEHEKTVSVTRVNRELLGSVKLIKGDVTDEAKFLMGAVFHIYPAAQEQGPQVRAAASGFTATATTGIDGSITVTGIPLGDYVAEEVQPPPGYELDGVRIQRFSITAENAANTPSFTLTYRNTPSVYSLLIKKVEKDSGNAASSSSLLSGAQFQVTNSNGFSKIVTTGENGMAVLENIPMGTYTVQEIKAPAGYDLDPNPHTVLVNTHGVPVEITVENTKIVGRISLHKQDETGATLDGATFELYDANGNLLKLTKTDENNYLLDAAGSVTSITAGSVTISNLPAGTYRLKETIIPYGYAKLDDTVTFTVDATNYKASIPVVIKNVKLQATVGILKVDYDNNSLRLPGAKFQLSKLTNGAYVPLMLAQTDASGYALFTNLEVGSYRITEYEAPAGYQKWANPIDFVVDADGNVKVGANSQLLEKADNVFTATVVNRKSTQQFAVEKIDSETGALLSGAVFQLTGNGNTYSLTTGATGRSATLTLPVGEYVLRELSAPSGYSISRASYAVSVTAAGVSVDGVALSGSTYVFVAENDPITYWTVISKVDAGTGAALQNASFRLYSRNTGASRTLRSGSDGLTAQLSLAPGVYDIVEIAAPSGYVLPLQGWTLRIYNGGGVNVTGSGASTYYSGYSTIVLRIQNTGTGDDGDDDTTQIPLGPGPVTKTGQSDPRGMMLTGAATILFALIALILFVALGEQDRKTTILKLR